MLIDGRLHYKYIHSDEDSRRLLKWLQKRTQPKIRDMVFEYGCHTAWEGGFFPALDDVTLLRKSREARVKWENVWMRPEHVRPSEADTDHGRGHEWKTFRDVHCTTREKMTLGY